MLRIVQTNLIYYYMEVYEAFILIINKKKYENGINNRGCLILSLKLVSLHKLVKSKRDST